MDLISESKSLVNMLVFMFALLIDCVEHDPVQTFDKDPLALNVSHPGPQISKALINGLVPSPAGGGMTGCPN